MQDIEHIISELQTVTGMIWNEAMRSNVVAVEAIPADKLENSKTRGACVHILGGWHGSVSIECEVPLAEEASRRMFHQLDSSLVTTTDWQSVLKELTNVTGGNIKGLLGEGCILSTPRAWEGSNFSFTVPESKEILNQAFSILDMYFLVRIHLSTIDISELTAD